MSTAGPPQGANSAPIGRGQRSGDRRKRGGRQPHRRAAPRCEFRPHRGQRSGDRRKRGGPMSAVIAQGAAWSRVAAVVRKEVRDAVRDRRTLLVSLLTAAAAGPIFLMLIFNLIARQADRARELQLPVIGIQHAPALAAFLERNQATLSPAPVDYEAKLRAGDLDVVLVVDDQFAGDVAQGKQGTVRLVSDRSRDRAQASIRQAENLLRAYNRQWGTQRLLLRGVAPYVGNPLNVEDVDLATPSSRAPSSSSWSRSTRCSRRSWEAWRPHSTRRRASASANRSSRC